MISENTQRIKLHKIKSESRPISKSITISTPAKIYDYYKNNSLYITEPFTWHSAEQSLLQNLSRESGNKLIVISKKQLISHHQTNSTISQLNSQIDLVQKSSPHFNILLYGTIHIAKDSQKYIKKLLKLLSFNFILIELCPERLESSIENIRENFFKTFLLYNLLLNKKKDYTDKNFFLKNSLKGKKITLFSIIKNYLIFNFNLKNFILELFSWLQNQAAELMDTNLGGELLLPIRLAYLMNNYSEKSKGLDLIDNTCSKNKENSLIFYDEIFSQNENFLETLSFEDIEQLENQKDLSSSPIFYSPSYLNFMKNLTHTKSLYKKKKINKTHVILADQFYSKTISKLIQLLNFKDKILICSLVILEINSMLVSLLVRNIIHNVFLFYKAITTIISHVSGIFSKLNFKYFKATKSVSLIISSFFKKISTKIYNSFFKPFISNKFLSNYVNFTFNDNSFLEKEIEDFQNNLPKLSSIIISDRDNYLSDTIKQTVLLLNKKDFSSNDSYTKYYFDIFNSTSRFAENETNFQDLPIDVQNSIRSLEEVPYSRDGYNPNENSINILSLMGAGHLKGVKKNLLENFNEDISQDHKQGLYLVDMDKLFNENYLDL